MLFKSKVPQTTVMVLLRLSPLLAAWPCLLSYSCFTLIYTVCSKLLLSFTWNTLALKLNHNSFTVSRFHCHRHKISPLILSSQSVLPSQTVNKDVIDGNDDDVLVDDDDDDDGDGSDLVEDSADLLHLRLSQWFHL